MPQVVCAGHVNWDVTLRVERLPAPDGEARIRSGSQSCGGSAANVAAGLTGLDLDVTLVGSVGDDEHGLLAQRALNRAGINLSLEIVEGGQTAVKYLLVDDDGEVAVLGTDGDNEAVRPADVNPGLLDDADHLHLTSQRPATAERLADLAVQRGVPVSFDPGRRLDERDYGPVFERADIVFLNEHEAAALDEAPTCQRVVTTYGTDGAVLETPDGLYHHPSFGLGSVDSTGAGDAFAAGFVAAHLRDNSPERVLAVANACGALCTREEGAQADLSWAAIEAVFEEYA